MNTLFSELARHSAGAASELKVRSALNSMLWLSAILTPTLIGGAWLLRSAPILSALLGVCSVIPVLSTCGVFVYFALRRPEKLQSEDYQLRSESLRMIEIHAGSLNFDPSTLERISLGTSPGQLPKG